MTARYCVQHAGPVTDCAGQPHRADAPLRDCTAVTVNYPCDRAAWDRYLASVAVLLATEQRA